MKKLETTRNNEEKQQELLKKTQQSWWQKITEFIVLEESFSVLETEVFNA